MGLMTADFTGDAESEILLRPSLLVRAAREGATMYLRQIRPALTRAQIAGLGETERRHEALRRERSPAYRPSRHVETLAILLAETGRAA